jgi:PRC-barrel domain
MSATRAIFFGVALGLAAGATVAIAQDAETSLETDGATGYDMTAPAEAGQDGDASIGLDVDLTTAPLTELSLASADPEALLGTRVYDANGDWIGEISAVLPESDAGDRSVVIDVGGFLGVGEKPVQIPFDNLSAARTDGGAIDYVVVAMTNNELEALPEVEK